MSQQTPTIGPFWDEVGTLLVAAGLSDSEEMRKGVRGLLWSRDRDGLERWLCLSKEQTEELLGRWDQAQPRRKTIEPIDERELLNAVQ